MMSNNSQKKKKRKTIVTGKVDFSNRQLPRLAYLKMFIIKFLIFSQLVTQHHAKPSFLYRLIQG